MTFGEKIRARRKALGVKQGEMAKRIGISREQLSTYENDVHEPTLHVAMWIAVGLECGLSELLPD